MLIGKDKPYYDAKENCWKVVTVNGIEEGYALYVASEYIQDGVIYPFHSEPLETEKHHNHEHDFNGVIEYLLNNPSYFSIEGFEEYYSCQEQRMLNKLWMKLKDNITAKEIINMSDENIQVELVNGKIVPRAKTTTKHQLIVGELVQIIDHYLKSQASHGKVLSFLPIVLDDYNMFLPDVLVVSDKEKTDNDTGCVGVPDWIIEVAVPESRERDYFTAIQKYMNAGVKECWVVDIEQQKVLVHNFSEYDTSIFSFQDTVKSGIFDLEIDFKDVSRCVKEMN